LERPAFPIATLDGWKPERQGRIVGHGGCGRLNAADRVGFNDQILVCINRLEPIQEEVALAELVVIPCRAPELQQMGARCGSLTTVKLPSELVFAIRAI